MITFEHPGPPIPNGDGGFTQTWQPLTPPTWYVSIRNTTAGDLEHLAAGVVMTYASYLIRGRYRPDVTTHSRIVYDDPLPDGTTKRRVFFVNGVQNVHERDREMELFCEEQLETDAPAAATAETRAPASSGGLFWPTID